jgi:hypothetical protein
VTVRAAADTAPMTPSPRPSPASPATTSSSSTYPEPGVIPTLASGRVEGPAHRRPARHRHRDNHRLSRKVSRVSPGW